MEKEENIKAAMADVWHQLQAVDAGDRWHLIAHLLVEHFKQDYLTYPIDEEALLEDVAAYADDWYKPVSNLFLEQREREEA